MSSFGIIEVITLLMGMAGFGLSPNPKAPTADQSLAYALADADIVAHVDAVSVVPGNLKALRQLAEQPQIKASPELQSMVRKAISEVEGAHGVAMVATGIDLAKDIADATAFVRIVPGAEPSFVVAVHGKFSAKNLDTIAGAGGSLSRIGAATVVEMGPSQPSIGLTRDGVLLVGTPKLVRERLADGWKAPSHAAGTNLGYAADVLSARPVFALALTLSPAARGGALAQLGKQSFLSDVIKRHKAATFSVFHDGIGWTWVDSTKAGLDAMEQMSSGVIDVMRAAQIAPRGMAKIALGALDSYKGTSAQLDRLIKHKADLMKLVEAYTGDGSFKVALDKNPKALRLSVRATGKSASEVVPFGLLAPLAVLGYLEKPAAPGPGPVMVQPEAPAPIGKPGAAKPGAAKPAGGKPAAAKPAARKP